MVHYHCDPRRSSSIVQKESLVAGGPLLVWVDSPCACPNACGSGDLGLGTIFLILLSLSAAAYFVLGKAWICAEGRYGFNLVYIAVLVVSPNKLCTVKNKKKGVARMRLEKVSISFYIFALKEAALLSKLLFFFGHWHFYT